MFVYIYIYIYIYYHDYYYYYWKFQFWNFNGYSDPSAVRVACYGWEGGGIGKATKNVERIY